MYVAGAGAGPAVGGLLVSIILSLQFNCHSVTEATDAIQSRSVVETSIDIRQL